jgi:hypothetical protein
VGLLTFSASTIGDSGVADSGSTNPPNTARPGSISRFSRNIVLEISTARGPAIRTTPIPPRPGGVAIATIVSSVFKGRL